MLLTLKKSSCLNHELKLNRKQFRIPRNAKTEVGASALSETREISPESRYDVDSHIIAHSLISCKTEIEMSEKTIPHLRIPRSLLNHEYWSTVRRIYKEIYLIILENCCFAETTFCSGDKKIHLKPGQLCTTFRALVDLCNKNIRYQNDKVDLSLIQRCVSSLKLAGLSLHETIHDKTIITITHKDTCDACFGSNNTGNDTSSIQVRYSKEGNKEIKENNPISPSFRKSKKVLEEKTEVATRVFLSQTEKQEILKRLNNSQEDYQMCIEKLSSYKIATSKQYKSDFLAILKWVLSWLKEEKTKNFGEGNSVEFHKKIASLVESKFPGKKDICVGYNYIEFVNGPANTVHLKFGCNGFVEQVENNLRKMNLEFSFLKKLEFK